jgi:eukaryotic-like serine/threonine-protein kinase
MTGGSEEFLEKALSAAFALADSDSPQPVGGPVRAPKPTPLPERIGRYHVEALVGRGGIGLVLRARDAELDRPVAIKILHEHLLSDAEMVRRFVDEARIEGALEHPGVVPVHEMGRTPDGRPYFTMKLVEGETFAARLAARRSPAEDRLGFVSTFGTVCQIVGYAHARGVAHLDLKPSNILVGGFGEILVTDWGFAVAASRPAAAGPARQDRIVGTPAYMAPEQARGELARIGPRSDVFALGAMLCEVLTGVPAYAGESASEILLAASRAWLDDARKRLDGCGADAALVAVAQRCLAADPDERPADAGVIAEEIGRYVRSLDERARKLAIEAAEARTRAEAERRQRRLVVALAAVVLIAVVVGGGAWLWIERDRATRARDDDRLAASMAERIRILTERAREAPEPDAATWDQLIAAARNAAEFARSRNLGTDVREKLGGLAAATAAERAAAEQDSRTVASLAEIHERLGDARVHQAKDLDYAAAFKSAGIDVETLGAEAAAARIAASPLRTRLVSALDDWAHSRTQAGRADHAQELVAIANLVDRDQWRTRVRTAVSARDVAALEALAADPARSAESAESQVLLAASLKRLGRPQLAVDVLESVERTHPGDYDVHHELGMLYRDATPPRLQDAVRHFSMGLALRPKSSHAVVDLAQVFLQAGDLPAAERLLGEASRLDPAYAPAWHYLGSVETLRREWEAAERFLRKASELDPGWAHSRATLAGVLRELGRLDDAVAELRTVLARHPGFAEAWCDLGKVLIDQGKFAEGRECLRKGHELGKARGAGWTHPSGNWIAEADALIAKEEELGAVDSDLTGYEDLKELYQLAEPAYLLGRTLTAARIMERVLAAPGHEAAAPLSVLLLGARAAAAAGTGVGKEPVDAKEAQALRDRARSWLSRAIGEIEGLEAGSPERKAAVDTASAILREQCFAGVRDQPAVSRLSAAESKAWDALWDRARAALRVSGK